jgi:radical SAM superfamily enzyme YgiQ (UPF0313 family)
MVNQLKPKVVIAAVPYVDTDEPIMAPGVLKAVLAEHGYDCLTMDLNIEVLNKIATNPNRKQIINFFTFQNIHDEITSDLSNIIDYCADRVTASKPDIIGLSLLIHTGQAFTAWMCAAIRHRLPECRIVLGGAGIIDYIADDIVPYCQRMRDLGLADDYISGNAEISFLEYIKGNREYPGINSLESLPVPDLNTLPYPDYSDYNFFLYNAGNIPIFDSRGCVRNCEFCSVTKYWEKFQYKTAECIFKEMMHQIEVHDRRNFDFRSSLVNGNLKEFKKLVDLIYDYNVDRHISERISWQGYYIIRPASQHPEELWRKMSVANTTLFVGIESLISSVRNSLGKVFENEDIDYHLEMGRKYGVTLTLLLISGYPTETRADWEFTKQWFRDRTEYAGTPVNRVVTSNLFIMPGTLLERNSASYGLTNVESKFFWANENLKITPADREVHRKELNQVIRDSGFVN